MIELFTNTETNGTVGFLFRVISLGIFVLLFVLSLKQFSVKRAIRFKLVMSGIFLSAVVTLSLPVYQQYLKSMGMDYLHLTPYANIVSSFGALVIAIGFLYQYTRNNK